MLMVKQGLQRALISDTWLGYVALCRPSGRLFFISPTGGAAIPDNGRTVYISDLNELRDWIDERIERLRQEQSADLQQLRDDIRRVTDDHKQRGLGIPA